MSKKETTTAAIAPFQHKVNFGVVRRPDCLKASEWVRGKEKCGKKGCKSCSHVDETADRADSRLGPWTFEKPTPYGHPLNDKAPEGVDSKAAPRITDDQSEGDPKKRVKKIKDLVAARNKEASRHMREATVSGQALGNPSTGAVAGTDTRLGGVSFEPVSFEKSTNAVRNEKVFYQDSEKSVLLPGWEYIADYAKRTGKEIRGYMDISQLRFSDDEIDNQEVDGDEDEGVSQKLRTGIDWTIDGPNHAYKKLLQRLRKAHKI